MRVKAKPAARFSNQSSTCGGRMEACLRQRMWARSRRVAFLSRERDKILLIRNVEVGRHSIELVDK